MTQRIYVCARCQSTWPEGSTHACPASTQRPVRDADWARLTHTIGRLAPQLDAAGRTDLHHILDFIEQLATTETA